MWHWMTDHLPHPEMTLCALTTQKLGTTPNYPMQHMQIGSGRNACGYLQLTAYRFQLPIAKLKTILGTTLLAKKCLL